MNVKFHDWHCSLKKAQYANGRDALLLLDANTEEPVAYATVNLPDHHIQSGHVFIKDWSENEGMYETLLESGVIKEVVNQIRSGFVMIKECPLTELTTALPYE